MSGRLGEKLGAGNCWGNCVLNSIKWKIKSPQQQVTFDTTLITIISCLLKFKAKLWIKFEPRATSPFRDTRQPPPPPTPPTPLPPTLHFHQWKGGRGSFEESLEKYWNWLNEPTKQTIWQMFLLFDLKNIKKHAGESAGGVVWRGGSENLVDGGVGEGL